MDIEADGLHDTVSKVFCASFLDLNDPCTEENVLTLTDPHDIIELVDTKECITGLIGHNIIDYDMYILSKLYDYTHNPRYILDTLVLSRLIYIDKRISHSLDSWGEDLGIVKPKHEDWTKLSEQMIHRNVQDVLINHKLIHRILDYSKLPINEW